MINSVFKLSAVSRGLVFSTTSSDHCRLTSSRGNRREYPHKPYTTRNYSHCATSLPLQYRFIFITISVEGSETQLIVK